MHLRPKLVNVEPICPRDWVSLSPLMAMMVVAAGGCVSQTHVFLRIEEMKAESLTQEPSHSDCSAVCERCIWCCAGGTRPAALCIVSCSRHGLWSSRNLI